MDAFIYNYFGALQNKQIHLFKKEEEKLKLCFCKIMHDSRQYISFQELFDEILIQHLKTYDMYEEIWGG